MSLAAFSWLAAMGTVASAVELPEPPVLSSAATSFDLERDAFGFSNGLRWTYGHSDGEAIKADEKIDGEYDQHCVAMVRAVRQFYYAARFVPEAPRATQNEDRELLAEVLKGDPRRTEPVEDPISIPGYRDLAEFSAANESLVKEALGGSWQTYRQRGNWRMVFAFSPRQRRESAESLLASLEAGHPPIVHVVRFPRITINHTLMLYRAESTTTEIRFEAYDPNGPGGPLPLRFDRALARFELAPTRYFPGGPVDVYEIFRGTFY